MLHYSMALLTVVNLLAQLSYAAPAPAFISPSTSPINMATRDADNQLWNTDTEVKPIRGALGAILGPQNVALEQQNPDIFSPPKTDHGLVPNVKWPFSLSHNRVTTGGWAREQNSTSIFAIVFSFTLTHKVVNALPVATSLAGDEFDVLLALNC
jgi:hypothetical protein